MGRKWEIGKGGLRQLASTPQNAILAPNAPSAVLQHVSERILAPKRYSPRAASLINNQGLQSGAPEG